jgi:hypothetical protein
LAYWRYTLGQKLAAMRLFDQFERRLASHLSGQDADWLRLTCLSNH